MANETGIQNLIRDYTTESSNSGSKSSLSEELPCVGSIVRYTATGSISAGQPVALQIPNDGIIKAGVATTPITSSTLLGVALQTVTDGQFIKILEEGYTTVSFQTASSATNIALTQSNSGTTASLSPGEPILFTDSGGPPNLYGKNETYDILFDAGAGYTVLMAFPSMSFEDGSTTRLYDRLGFLTGSDSSGTFGNAQVSWMQKMSDNTYPWTSNSLEGSFYYSADSKNGWVLPQTMDRAIENGITGSGAGGADDFRTAFLDWGTRFVRASFRSDGSNERPGWQILVKSSNETLGEPIATTPGALLYIDTAGRFADVSGSSQHSIAKAITPATSGSAVYAYVNARGL